MSSVNLSAIKDSDNFKDLHSALKQSLDQRGVLNSIRATMRAEIFNALEDHDAVNINPVERQPSSENLILNELIREYLEYNGFLNTLSVFHPETGQPKIPTGRIGREVLIHELDLADGERAKRVPLLYSVLAKLQHNSNQTNNTINNNSSSSNTNNRADTGSGGNIFDQFPESSVENDQLGQSVSSASGRAIGFSN